MRLTIELDLSSLGEELAREVADNLKDRCWSVRAAKACGPEHNTNVLALTPVGAPVDLTCLAFQAGRLHSLLIRDQMVEAIDRALSASEN